MEPEFAALNFPCFEPEDEMEQEAEVSNGSETRWYHSPLCPWNWVFPFLAPEERAPAPSGGAPQGAAPQGATGSVAPSSGSASALPGVTKKKKKKAKSAEGEGEPADAPELGAFVAPVVAAVSTPGK